MQHVKGVMGVKKVNRIRAVKEMNGVKVPQDIERVLGEK